MGSAPASAASPSPVPAGGTVRLLGPFAVELGGRPVGLGGLRQRAVLALLAMRANDVVARDTLIEELWAGSPPASAVSTLQGYVSHLRRALEGGPFTLASRGPGYALEADERLIDAHLFLLLVAEAQTEMGDGRAAMAAERLEEALALWRGPALADFAYEDFARAAATRLEEARLAALSLRVEADLTLGHHRAAATRLEQLVRDHPLREDFRAQLMRAMAAGGRRAEALRVYQEGRRIFSEELGLDPSLSLQRLERAILAQDPSVEEPPTPVTAPNRLPAATTSFVGRQEELKSVADLVRERRLVTITGPGGIGKTRLALEVARALAAEQPDGAFLVELASVADPGLVAPTVAKVLGAQVQPDRPVLETLEQVAAHRSALIVVDNCEHVLEAAATVTSALLRAAPGTRVVATSRQPLGLAAETVWSTPTLEVPAGGGPGPGAAPDAEDLLASDAVRLFVERADTAWPGFSLSEDNAAAVARICQRLDGMPLAIELAAARLRSLSVEQVADRLDDRFRLLTTGDRAALPRQRTLEASVEWSHDLLTDDERALFRRLAVFAGSFDLGAAEAVCSDEGLDVVAVVDLCGELVDKSLLTRVTGPQREPRYRMLETIRQFGLARLAASTEEASVRAAHARAFSERALAAVARLHGPETGVWVGQLDADRADLRAALEWLVEEGDPAAALRLATGLWLYWRYRDEPAEGRSWLARALARGEPGRQERLAAAVADARLALVDDDPEGAEAACALGLGLLGPGDGWSRAHFCAVQGERLRFEGSDPAAAERLASEAVTGFSQEGDAYWEGHARRVLGQLAWDSGDLTRATTLAGQCLNLFETCGDAEGMAGAKIMLAGLARDQGDSVRAARLYEESLAAFRVIDQPWGQAEAARHFGTLVLAAGDVERAEELGGESLRLCEDLGLGRGAGQTLELLARVAFERRDLDKALELSERSLARLRTDGYPGDVAAAACTAAHVALHLGLLVRAEDLLRDSIGPRRGFGYRRNPALALALLARVRVRQGDAAGLSLAEEAVELARGAGDARTTAAGLEALAGASLLAEAGADAAQAARLVLLARYTRQTVGLTMTAVEAEDHRSTVEAVRAALTGEGAGSFAQVWGAAWDSEVIDLTVLEALAATPEDVLSRPPAHWDGVERRHAERRGGERRAPGAEVGVSATSDRRLGDRRRWGRRRSDRVL